MEKSLRYTKFGFILLSISIILWITALLFLFRIINIFDANLMKFPGPVVIFGTMSAFPLVTMFLGIKLIKAQENACSGWLFAVSGGFLSLASIEVIGLPVLRNANQDRGRSVNKAK